MKRFFAALSCVFVLFPLFAVNDITLYTWEDSDKYSTVLKFENDFMFNFDKDSGKFDENPVGYVKEGKLYDSESDELCGSVSQTEEFFSLSYIEGSNSLILDFNSSSGILVKVTEKKGDLVYEEFLMDFQTGAPLKDTCFYPDGKISYEDFYDAETHLELKYVDYEEDGSVNYTECYEYPEANKIITKKYDKENKLSEIIENECDENGNLLKATLMNDKNVLLEVDLYNAESEYPYKETTYYENGNVKSEKNYNPDNYNLLSEVLYSEAGKKTEHKFVQFDEYSECKLDDDLFLSTAVADFSTMEDYAKQSLSDYIDWNDNYYALVSKFNFNMLCPEYKYLKYLKDQNYLIQSNCVVMFSNYSTDMYCFSVKDGVIVMESCYKISLIAKPDF